MGISYPAPEAACYGQITREQYDALLAKLQHDKDAAGLMVVHAADSGRVTYQKIDFSWQYIEATSELTLRITADHNWKAKLAGNQAIFGIVYDQLIAPLSAPSHG